MKGNLKMNHMKKLASILLVLIMVLTVATTAFAAETTGSITINDAIVGQTYTVYQILDLESYNATSNAYSYKAASAWSDFINSNAIKETYVSVDDQGYVTWIEGADAAAFAKAAQKYAKDNSIGKQGTTTATTTTVSFTGLDLGYYLVDTTLGTLCSLDTTNPDVTMEEKNEVPTNVKTVEEDSTNQYGEKNDADIGQTVNFKSTITAQAGAENYVFHDKMSAGLTYGTVTGITLNGNIVGAFNYTVAAPAIDGDTFDVTFTQAFCDTLKANDKIVISYTATVNENAVIGGEGNDNTAKLSYGDSSNIKTTPDSTTKTYTWSFDILKYGNNDETNVLKDAKFVLLNKDKNKVAAIVNGKFTEWVDVPAAGKAGVITWPANTELTTDANGKIDVKGLDADTYYLRETQAPAGYNKLANDVEVKIEPAASADGKVLTLTAVTSKINNNAGTELPSTGGMGTTIFYVLGSILVIGSAVLLITKKRMRASK